MRLTLFVFFNVLMTSLIAQEVYTWDVIQLTFNAEETYKNPYKDIPTSGEDLLRVEFYGTSGPAKGEELSIVGCWNGESQWVVSFSATRPGTWQYESISRDKGMDGIKGEVEVKSWSEESLKENPIRRGLVRVENSGVNSGHYFKYSDGTPFLWVGDTWWNWTKRSIDFKDYKDLVDDRSDKGFNIGQLFVPGNGWSSESSLFIGENYDQLDPEHVQHVESMIEYANEKGITVWIHAWWSRPNIDRKIGEEKILRWWKYLINRFGAYNVIWILAGEYNMHDNGGFSLSFWNRLGQYIKDNDPYERIVSIHNTPPFWEGGADAPQWSTGQVLHDQSWIDYNQSQTGHGRYANEMIPQVVSSSYQLDPPKPIVVTEPWYEFVEGNPTGKDVRLAIWGSILSGAAGHTYGGGHVWLAHTPTSPAGGGGTWPLEVEFSRTTYSYEGAVSMGVMSKFFDNIDWWEMSPHPELISDYPQPFCLASPGEEYIIYLRYGGYLSLDLRAFDGTFEYTYLDPSNGEKKAFETIRGGDIFHTRSPSGYPGTKHFKDWVLWVRKQQ